MYSDMPVILLWLIKKDSEDAKTTWQSPYLQPSSLGSITDLTPDPGAAGIGPLPADGRHPGRRAGPGHPKCKTDRQWAVLLQGGHWWCLQWQEGDHEPESGQRWATRAQRTAITLLARGANQDFHSAFQHLPLPWIILIYNKRQS